MRITLFKDLSGREAQTIETTWEALAEWVTNAAVFPNKESLPLIKLGVFGDVRTDKGSLRHDANLLAISGVEGDYDGEVLSIDEAAKLLSTAGVKALLYTSPSNRPEAPRWRVLCPLSREHPPGMRRAFLERVNGVLGGVLTAESFTTSQAFYVGRVQGAAYEVH